VVCIDEYSCVFICNTGQILLNYKIFFDILVLNVCIVYVLVISSDFIIIVKN